MRKTNSFKNPCLYCAAVLIMVMLCAPHLIFGASLRVELNSQVNNSKKITGTVKDEQGTPMPGVSITVDGSSVAAMTDINGNYVILVPDDKNIMSFSFMGYETRKIAIDGQLIIDIQMNPSIKNIDEVVVIGYGTQAKKDLTGSITSVTSKDFNPGTMMSTEQLISGKVAGVQIISNSGSPTSGSTIRIRGGASLNASNDPLIVIDGVPLENGGISGNKDNFMSLINPNDIESISILKDASSTAIYGSRASNGVMMITTKKGNIGKLKLNFSSNFSLQFKTRVAEMLSPDEFRTMINEKGSDIQKALLGPYSTDWNKEIFQRATGTDNNLSLSGALFNKVPIRASFGYYNQDGILKTDNAERTTLGLVLTPSLLNDHLKLNFNVKGSVNKNSFANTNAIYSASVFNPTQPVHSGDQTFGGYYESIDQGLPVVGALLNPLGLLEQEQHKSTVRRSIGNMDIDYKLHFLPELKAHITLGYDIAKGEGTNYIPETAAVSFKIGGKQNEYSQTLTNKLFTGYLNYNKEFESIKSHVDITLGHDYQNWYSKSPQFVDKNIAGDTVSISAADAQRHVLLSFYGRLHYTLFDKFILTATIRRDGTSRFNPDNRWGTFPSMAFAWKIKESDFLKNVKVISDLKVRVGYGVTGQQEGIGNYSYLPVYTISNNFARYRLGDQYYNTYRPETYISNLKWETTGAYNIGADFGVLDNRIYGSVDYYKRKTKDLLAQVSVAAGTNFGSTATTNVGNIESNGLEVTLNLVLADSKKFKWTVGFNGTYQKVKITNLTLVKDASSPGTFASASALQVGGRGIQIMTEGYAPYMFYVYKQIYDAKGKPIQGMYADLDGNGAINEHDLYRYHSPMPDYLLGFNSQISYLKWNLGFTLRASIGNYVYNSIKANQGSWETVQYVTNSLNNVSRDYLKTGFTTRQYYSDYFVENASFLKMDNISLGYSFGQLFKGVNLRIGALVQNVFTITKYTGVDPEIGNGFDSQFYPRPRTFSFNLNLDF